MYGSSPSSLRQGVQVYGQQKLTMCLPLLSGTVGLGADKLLPIGALSDDIRIELTWESQTTAVAYSTTTPTASWQILQAELELCIIELSDEGEAMVQSVTPYSQPIFLHGNSWRHYVSNLAASTTGGVSYLVPARFASLKTLVLLPRCTTQSSGAKSYSISSRGNPAIATYWWRVGAYIIPNKFVTLYNPNTTAGYAEAFAEVTKSFHSLTAPQYAAGIPFGYYNIADAAQTDVAGGAAGTGGLAANQTDGSSYQNAFAIAQELESWANRSDVLISGMNTLASQVFFEANLNSTGVSSSAGYILDFYANYDMILVLENGLLSAKF